MWLKGLENIRKKEKKEECVIVEDEEWWKEKKIVILIIKEDVYGWYLVIIYIIMLAIMENYWGYSLCLVKKKNWKWENRSYQYYYTNDECKLISNIKFN